MSGPRERRTRSAESPALQLVHSSHASGESPGEDGDGRVAETAPGSDTGSDLETAQATDAALAQARELLASTDPLAYYQMLTSMVRPTHSSILQELSYNPALPFHDPSCVVVEPDPSNIETLELYVKAAYPDVDKVLTPAFGDPRNDHLLTALYLLLFAENANVALVTNHGQIIDIAIVMGALQSALMAPGRSFGVLGERTTLDETADRANVLVSRMVATRQAFNIPALQLLQSGTRTYLSVPQTHSRRRSRLDPELARANNLVMRHELNERMARGGQLLAMAASGSQDLMLPKLMQKARTAWRQRRGDDPGETNTLHLQPLYDGTIKLMRSCTYVLPVAICLDPSTPACVLGGLTRVSEDEDCHRIMDWIALAHQEATGIPTIYHWHEDDLLDQVRSFMNRAGQ